MGSANCAPFLLQEIEEVDSHPRGDFDHIMDMETNILKRIFFDEQWNHEGEEIEVEG